MENNNQKGFSWFISFEAELNSFKMSLKAIAFLIFVCFFTMLTLSYVIVDITGWIPFRLTDYIVEALKTLNDVLLKSEIPYDVKAYRETLFAEFWDSFKILFIGTLPGGIGASILVQDHIHRKTKDDMTKNKYVSGTQLTSEKNILKEIRKDKLKSNFKLGSIPFPEESETTGIMIGGAAGAGKTLLIRPIISYLVDNNKKGIIHDIKGDFVQDYYDENKGHLLFNPMDARSVKTNWTIFNDVRDVIDIKNFASWIIPDNAEAKDPFWNDSARGILEGIMYIMFENFHEKGILPTNEEMKKYAALSSFDLAMLLKEAGHNAASDYAAKKDSLSTFRSKMSWLFFLPDGEFSVRKWMDSEDGNLIFLSNREDTREMFKSAISLLINVAGSHLLSKEDDLNRRVYFILDEFTNLSPLPKILELLKMGRSKGAAILLAFQDYQMLQKIYSEQDTYTFVNNTASKAILKLKEPRAAKYFAEFFGQYTFLEKNQTISMGVSENKDGMSINEQRKDEFAVKDTDILNLPPLFAFVKIERIKSISKISIPIISVAKISQAFVPKILDVKTQIRIAKALSVVVANNKAEATAVKTDDETVINFENLDTTELI